MSIRITFLGHSAFSIEAKGKTILIDPFLTDNPSASTSADELNADAILVTHGHGDHVGDTVSIAKRTGAIVISNFEIINWMTAQGVENTHAMNIGGKYVFDFGIVRQTLAFHSSTLPDGSHGGCPTGFLLNIDGKMIYHAGDTSLFSDLQIIAKKVIDVAILPIGDNFTMGPQDSAEAVQLLKPKLVIPCHYNTWPIIEQNPDSWASLIQSETNAEPLVLQPGESKEI